MNKAAQYIIDCCIEHSIGTLVVGYNPNWKWLINIGKRNNQNFVQIPHVGLRHKLQRLCQRYEIQYVEQAESYTSKASFLDHDQIPNWLEESKEYEFSSHRVHRGFYKGADGSLINADSNGAANILRKVSRRQTADCVRGLWRPLQE